MATTLGPTGAPPPPPLTPKTSTEPSSYDHLRSARLELARHESPRRRALRLGLVLIALAVLVKGWLVTDIDLGKLSNASNAAPILKALVQPDVLSRDVLPLELQEPFIVGAGSSGPAVVSTPAGQTLRITPGSGTPGQTVVFEGSGFEPDADGQLRLLNPSRGVDVLFTRLHTDRNGSFREERVWPDFATLPPDIYQFKLVINALTGSPHLSETFLSSLGRMGETILLALMGTVFGVLFSVPLSFLGARNLMGTSPVGLALYAFVRLFFTITRSIEVLIVGLITVVIVGIGSYAGVLALVIHSIGSLGKLFSEVIENIEPGPIEAITATGANRFQTVLYGVIPQIVPAFLAVTIYWWDHNLRMSTVIGLVGGGGIGFLLIQYMNLLQYNQAATVLWLIVIAVTAMDYASAAIRARLI
ncbi:MAG TPA: phosphonate ABC transporter, permease protein PhnE [Chloroflexota bacterium]|jgi:phosphonate transport system permease protein|nr:phosphonate ABC transporter, permease protein PhnE [Chloroflexota bacterium]